ncbi:MAG: hypothetical protein LBG19_03665 [Prevotellaceae bacterium]|jgi:hypothetical protein|nr:hypothetical protein [Prevotellaceae bacterium]
MSLKTFTLFFLLTLGVCSVQAQPVQFNADFEAGSLGGHELIDSVWFKRTAEDSTLMLSYNIYSRLDPDNPIDTTLPPSGRWLYFQMTGVKDKQLFLTFHNTDPLRCMYSYDNETFERLPICDAPTRRKVEATFGRDTVYLAYYTPYTYTYLQKRLNDWVTKNPQAAKLETIGQSTQNRLMQLLTITDPNTDNSGKKRVWIQGRIHTSESPASWHLDGFIGGILADTPEAEAIRKSIIFYINPYVNPDGVYHGLSRSNANGVNLEINWGRPEEQTEQEIKVLKAKMTELINKDGAFDMYLGMHSQVANRGTYWIHKAESTNERFFQREMLLAYLTCATSPNYLIKEDLDFSNVAPRYPEGWIWDTSNDTTLAITFETPYTYYSNRPDKPWVTNENLRDFGVTTLRAVADYFGISSTNRIIIDNTDAKLGGGWNTVRSTDVVFHGEDCVAPQKAGSKIIYRTSNVTAGSYKVYIWHPGSVTNESVSNTWLYLQDYQQKKSGKLSLKLKAENAHLANGKAKLYDAILLVRDM